MDNRNNNFHHPPIFDVNNLDKDHEILIDYDGNGNPTRIRKVPRYEGCAFWLAMAAMLILLGLALAY